MEKLSLFATILFNVVAFVYMGEEPFLAFQAILVAVAFNLVYFLCFAEQYILARWYRFHRLL